MNRAFYNLKYFIKEAYIIFRTNKLSNILSILSLTLIFFLFAFLAMGKNIGDGVVRTLSKQAEISVYYVEGIDNDELDKLVRTVERIDGVLGVHRVSTDEAFERMVEVLGKDSAVLSYFESNPFIAFLELEVNLDKVENIVNEIESFHTVESVRDNLDILATLRRIIGFVSIAFAFVSIAMGISTIVLTSHIIRQGIYNNREQIQTMTLLGAPNSFMMLPYIIEGLFVSLSSAFIASMISVQGIIFLYSKMSGPFPLIPMPPRDSLLLFAVSILMSTGFVLGILGSYFGWISVKE